MSEEETLKPLIMELTLKNALKYNGKPMAKTIIGGILGKHPEFRPHAKLVKKLTQDIVHEISEMSMKQIQAKISASYPHLLESSKKIRDNTKKSLPELDNVIEGETKVVLRLPPEPSGYLHIGHAYAGYINYLYKKKYNGRLILRFEDTNPKKVKTEFYNSIKEAYAFLGIEYDDIIYESDHLGHYLDQAKVLIQQNKAYVCSCTVDETRTNRLHGTKCIHRNHDLDQNLSLWEDMNSNLDEGEAVLRLKANMSDTREALRDPTIMRILLSNHPRIGDKYRVYPLYDFAVSIEDAKVTHVLRSEEFLPKVPLQNLIRSYLDLPNPTFKHFSRLKVINTPVRKRVIRDLIERKVITDWGDPRLSTISGLRSRGIRPETMREIVYELRLSSSQSKIGWPLILSINRKILDPIAPRFFAVIDPINLKIKGFDSKKVILKNHPNNSTLGTRQIPVSNELWISSSDLTSIKHANQVRLKGLLDVDIIEISKNNILCQLCEKIDQNAPVVQWVSKSYALPLELRKINELYLTNSDADGNSVLNPHSWAVQNGFVEKNIQNLSKYDTLQLERIGFACVENILNKKVILNLT